VQKPLFEYFFYLYKLRNKVWDNGYLGKWQQGELADIIRHTWSLRCCHSFETFISLLEQHNAFCNLDKKHFFERAHLLFSYVNLLPRETQKMYPQIKYWLHSNLAYYYWWYKGDYSYLEEWHYLSYVSPGVCEKCSQILT